MKGVKLLPKLNDLDLLLGEAAMHSTCSGTALCLQESLLHRAEGQTAVRKPGCAYVLADGGSALCCPSQDYAKLYTDKLQA